MPQERITSLTVERVKNQGTLFPPERISDVASGFIVKPPM
jgi:hypothetical protein